MPPSGGNPTTVHESMYRLGLHHNGLGHPPLYSGLLGARNQDQRSEKPVRGWHHDKYLPIGADPSQLTQKQIKGGFLKLKPREN